jgi:hypothetical protein
VIQLGRDDAAAPAGKPSLAGSKPHDAGTARDTAPAELPDSPQRAAARPRWARLLARIYEVIPLACPDCGGDMRTLAFITAAEPVDAVLIHLGLPITPPPLSPARGPPQHDLAFDADPGFDLDQTPDHDLPNPNPPRTLTPIRAPAPEAEPRAPTWSRAPRP